jgi:MinD superfamily P-loop ATPase
MPSAVTKEKVLVFPELCQGCGACSYLCPEAAISEEDKETVIMEMGSSDGIEFVHCKLNVREAMASPIIRQVKKHTNPQSTVIIDVSPGTSCPIVESIKGSDLCILVTEPTPFGLNDLVLAVEVVKELGIPSSVVINRTAVGNGEVDEYCSREGTTILLTIPVNTDIARLYSQGTPLVEGIPKWKGTSLSFLVKSAT